MTKILQIQQMAGRMRGQQLEALQNRKFLIQKNDDQDFLLNGLSPNGAIVISDLCYKISQIHYKYNTGDGSLSPKTIGKTSRIQRLQYIQD